MCARYLHGLRAPAPGPFVAVNCAAIPKDLMESELFGHEKGAFTGATSRHLGYAERARDGILFLDEIGELDLKLQTKLLRLLEDRTFHRLGGESEVPFKARLVCATNADLEARIGAGGFREDLYYRINVLTVPVPPLRERPDDVEWLAVRFADAFCHDAGAELSGFSGLALEELRSHAWPGNVRELRNRIERAVALSPGPWIMPGDLFPERNRSGCRGKDAGIGGCPGRGGETCDRAGAPPQRRCHQRGRRGPRNLPKHDVGEDATASHRGMTNPATQTGRSERDPCLKQGRHVPSV